MAKKAKRFKKGSKEARAFMARLRKMRYSGSRKPKAKKRHKRIYRSTQKTSLSPIIIKGETTMARRKGSVKRAAKTVARRVSSAARKVKPLDILMEMAGISVGAIGGSFVANMVPIKEAKIKALIPIIIGIGVPMLGKIGQDKMVRNIAMGSFAMGTISLLRQFIPNIPLLAGGESIGTAVGSLQQLSPDEKMLLGMSGITESPAFGGVQTIRSSQLNGAAAPYGPENVF